jgi:hypothetical protein
VIPRELAPASLPHALTRVSSREKALVAFYIQTEFIKHRHIIDHHAFGFD